MDGYERVRSGAYERAKNEVLEATEALHVVEARLENAKLDEQAALRVYYEFNCASGAYIVYEKYQSNLALAQLEFDEASQKLANAIQRRDSLKPKELSHKESISTFLTRQTSTNDEIKRDLLLDFRAPSHCE